MKCKPMSGVKNNGNEQELAIVYTFFLEVLSNQYNCVIELLDTLGQAIDVKSNDVH